MKTVAVICEYNPFHQGHRRQIDQIRRTVGEDTAVLSLMSGNFVQRGEPAVLPKYYRAAWAVSQGSDLVLELPYPWSCASAQFFAQGAISLLNALGCVDALCFGWQSRSPESLKLVSARRCSDAFLQAMKQAENETGSEKISEIRRQDAVYRALYGESLPTCANDILAAAYYAALTDTDSKISPLPIRREGEWTASAARQALRSGALSLPDFSFSPVPKITSLADFSDAVLGFFRLTEAGYCQNCEGCTGGRAYRLQQAAWNASDFDGFLGALREKTVTDSNLRRSVFYAMTGVTRQDLVASPAYTTVLGASARGRKLLGIMRKTATVPVITRPAAWHTMTEQDRRQGELTARADSLYALSQKISGGDFLKCRPLMT